ncbi:NAD(P)/FAD-dependent oxidoreductase [Natrialba swarupiae]|uniref:Thioredoxin reductase-like protein n=1 Tax=Natrialba swarupiae TaxID=2448032 RepID=A0A5D5AQA3_9EURY|nr:NAD(P)/FAD-dependent oxidoreductase [Natrialba swarupiae]TYT63929.1 thioredoxin reductase-like protein [Natrialba swarupiae]
MSQSFDHEVAIVGAGPAGIGTGVALSSLDVEFVVLERDRIGASFRQWPAEMRLLTPSFPANAFGVRDLNAITPDTSPGLALDCEHPTGDQYADYLEAIAEYHELPIETGVDVDRVVPDDRAADAEDSVGFTLETSDGSIRTRYVIWAAGQYQYPTDGAIPGSSHAVHVSSIDSWAHHADTVGADLAADDRDPGSTRVDESPPTAADGAGVAVPPSDDVAVIGGAESGIDAALGLSETGLSVTVLDEEGTWQYRSPDPSEVLSPRTNERLEAALADDRPIELVPGARVDRIERVRPTDDQADDIADVDEGYDVFTADGERVRSRTPPVLATGFEGSLTLVEDLFAFDGEFPELTDCDESTATPGLFLVGPQVAHDGQQFCFIYKFRQRFAVVAETIGERLGADVDPLSEYREKEMFLEDLDCCEPDYCDC